MLHNFRTYYEVSIKPIDQKGEHNVQLTYFDNIDTTTTQRPVYIGEGIDFLKYEEDTSAYWYDKNLKKSKYSLATAPQALLNFDLDKDMIRREFVESLNNISAFMKKNPNTIIKIYGHTDSRGSDEYNQQLSERRAKAVFTYLMKSGISTKRMEWKGKGETELLWKIDSAEWAARENRRVEIVIWKK
ncbi:MAG: OmpA family protein [Bacteroidota bacterium]